MDPKPRVSSPRANPSSSYSLPMLNYFDSFTFNYIFRYFPILKVGHSLEIDLTFFLKKKKKQTKNSETEVSGHSENTHWVSLLLFSDPSLGKRLNVMRIAPSFVPGIRRWDSFFLRCRRTSGHFLPLCVGRGSYRHRKTVVPGEKGALTPSLVPGGGAIGGVRSA